MFAEKPCYDHCKIMELKGYMATYEFESTTHFLAWVLGNMQEGKPFSGITKTWMEHSSRVGKASEMVSRKLGLSSSQVNEIYISGICHDWGKIFGFIGEDGEALNRNGALTAKEKVWRKYHPELGVLYIEFLDPDGRFGLNTESIKQNVLHHHEFWDGTGYPGGMKGEEIPVGSEIIRPLDFAEAACNREWSMNEWNREKAVEYIRNNAGKRFSPRVVPVVLDLLEHDDFACKLIPEKVHSKAPGFT